MVIGAVTIYKVIALGMDFFIILSILGMLLVVPLIPNAIIDTGNKERSA